MRKILAAKHVSARREDAVRRSSRRVHSGRPTEIREFLDVFRCHLPLMNQSLVNKPWPGPLHVGCQRQTKGEAGDERPRRPIETVNDAAWSIAETRLKQFVVLADAQLGDMRSHCTQLLLIGHGSKGAANTPSATKWHDTH